MFNRFIVVPQFSFEVDPRNHPENFIPEETQRIRGPAKPPMSPRTACQALFQENSRSPRPSSEHFRHGNGMRSLPLYHSTSKYPFPFNITRAAIL
ncbi:hypothetical protein SLA2020_191830 [Shorea laevis]